MTDEERPFEQEGMLEPFTNLLEAAVAMHEMYVTYVEAGFEKDEALYLVAQILRPSRGG